MTIIATYRDLVPTARTKHIEDIEISDFKESTEPYERADMVVFKTSDVAMVIKNRSGGKLLTSWQDISKYI